MLLFSFGRKTVLTSQKIYWLYSASLQSEQPQAEYCCRSVSRGRPPRRPPCAASCPWPSRAGCAELRPHSLPPPATSSSSKPQPHSAAPPARLPLCNQLLTSFFEMVFQFNIKLSIIVFLASLKIQLGFTFWTRHIWNKFLNLILLIAKLFGILRLKLSLIGLRKHSVPNNELGVFQWCMVRDLTEEWGWSRWKEQQ